MTKCVFAGTFDPFTLGHADVVEKCLKIFDEVVVAVLINKDKKQLFSTEQRVEMIKSVYKDEKKVKTIAFDGLLAELLKIEETDVSVRGVRDVTDYEYEKNMHYVNSDLNGNITTLFVPAEQKHLHISSSAVKTLLSFGKSVNEYVPPEVNEIIEKRLKEKNNGFV